jgi:GNAT superfamily N-acetyltransferase
MATDVTLKDRPADDTVVVDGGYLITNEKLAKIGHGDVKRGRRAVRMMLADAQEPKIQRGPTDKPTTVRAAVVGDEDAIFELLRMELREVAEGVAPPSFEKIMRFIRMGTEGKGVVIGVIESPEGDIVATVGMISEQWWFTESWHISELWNFVHPDHRRSQHAHDLIQFTKWASDEWTRRFGYQVFLVTGVLTTRRVHDKIRFYRRMLTQAGAWFLYPWPSRET